MGRLPDILFSAAQVGAMDNRAICNLGISGFELMSRAGYAVFSQIRSRWPDLKKLAILCGSGNNGGDGYVVAHLGRQAGYDVNVYPLIDPQNLTGDALSAAQQYLQAGGLCLPIDESTFSTPSVIVDALFGTGLSRSVQGAYADLIKRVNCQPSPIIAVDIPSGLHADTGTVMGCAIKADCTVTFIGLKQGLFTGQAAEYRGDVIFSGLQLPEDIGQGLMPVARLLAKPRLPVRHRCAHKGHCGHVLLVGGDLGFSGGIRLAAEAALRSGAGLVSVATRAQHCQTINLARPEMMVHAAESAVQLEQLLDKADVVVIGPGLGQSEWSREMMACVMKTPLPLVVDADGLNWLARQHDHKRENWVLTPHPGEAARLLAISTGAVERDRYAAVRALHQRYGGVCLLKGAGTLVQSDWELCVSTTGNPGMASGGMGDVLAGVIGALIAQGLTADAAATAAVDIHGRAADLLAAEHGERGLLAGDLLPVMRQLLND